MNYKKSTADAGTLLTFIIWPSVGFIVNFFKKPSTQKGILFATFYALVGYFFLLTDPAFDSYRYAIDFKQACTWGIESFLANNAESGMLDMYSIYSYRLVSILSDNPHMLFAFWGFIFGFFTYKTLQFSFDSARNSKVNKFAFGVLIIMFLINPYININGVRFWTAVWVFIAGWLGYEIHNKKKWLLVMCITPFVHTTFIIPLVIYLVYKTKVLQNLKVLFFVYIISFIIGNVVDLETITGNIPFLEMSERYSTYVDSDYVDSRNEAASGRSTLNTLLSELPTYFMLIFMTWLYASKKMFKYSKENIITKTLTFLLILLCICSILQSIPSFGRFDIICQIIMLYLIMLYKSKEDIKFSYMSPLLFIVFFGEIYNIWFIHNDLISLKYLLPFAYLF